MAQIISPTVYIPPAPDVNTEIKSQLLQQRGQTEDRLSSQGRALIQLAAGFANPVPEGPGPKSTEKPEYKRALKEPEKIAVHTSPRISHELYIVDAITGEKIRIDFVPPELEYTPEIRNVSIATIGRNTNYYQCTGSEDSLTFELDWLAKEHDRADVLKKCRWLEGLSKPDAYAEGRHPVILVWGRMYENVQWVIESCPYRMLMFHKTASMLPTQAYQKITLKKISDHNLTRKELQEVLVFVDQSMHDEFFKRPE